MTNEELRAHCEKQVKMCEEWAKGNDREPSGKIYEEHKLILDLINKLQDKSYELWKESYEEEHLRNIRLEEKIKALEQQPSDDCIARQPLIDNWNSCADMLMDEGDSAIVMDWIFDAPPVTPIQRWISVSERLPEESTAVLIWCPERKNIYCAYFEYSKWWIFGACFEEVELEVTAWQPLPKPYEEKRGDLDGSN